MRNLFLVLALILAFLCPSFTQAQSSYWGFTQGNMNMVTLLIETPRSPAEDVLEPGIEQFQYEFKRKPAVAFGFDGHVNRFVGWEQQEFTVRSGKFKEQSYLLQVMGRTVADPSFEGLRFRVYRSNVSHRKENGESQHRRAHKYFGNSLELEGWVKKDESDKPYIVFTPVRLEYGLIDSMNPHQNKVVHMGVILSLLKTGYIWDNQLTTGVGAGLRTRFFTDKMDLEMRGERNAFANGSAEVVINLCLLSKFSENLGFGLELMMRSEYKKSQYDHGSGRIYWTVAY